MEIALKIILIATFFGVTVIAIACTYDTIKDAIEEWRRKR